MTGHVVIGVDVGTTSTKVVAYERDGTAIADAARDYVLETPTAGWAEQDAHRVVDAVLDALAHIAAATPAPVRAIGLSTAMHTLIGLDHAGDPLTAMLTFADTRAWPQALRLRRAHGLALYHATGTPIHPMAPLAKLVWFTEERPDIARRVRRWVSIKELLLRRLCGSDVVDVAVAAASGLLDLQTLEWNAEALAAARVAPEQLGRPVPTTTVIDHLLPATARHLGLPTRTPVVVGASDGVLANLGAGAVERGVAALTIGTSGAIRTTATQPRTDPAMRTFCYPMGRRRWVVGGAINNGGLVPRWINGLLGGDDDYRELTAAAADVPIGSEGVTMLPYLTGERAPRWSPLRGGVVSGLRVEHHRGHVFRAALEGVALQLRLVADAVRAPDADPDRDDPDRRPLTDDADRDDVGPGAHTSDLAAGRRFDRVRATGGFVTSDLWLQIVADVLGSDIDVPRVVEAVAWGAALLAMDAVGVTADLDAAAGRVELARTVSADAGNSRRYDAVADRYAALATRMEPVLSDRSRWHGGQPQPAAHGGRR